MSDKLSPNNEEAGSGTRGPIFPTQAGTAGRCSVALRALFHSGESDMAEPVEDSRRARIEFLRASIQAGTYQIPNEQIAEAILNRPAGLWR